MVFDSIRGQDRVLAPLRRNLAQDRMHPSLLFHGPDGVGKRRTAFALAAALNCAAAPNRGCGTCSSCQRVLRGYDEKKVKGADGRRATGHHADVLYYPPKRRQIVIDQIQDLCREAAFRPFEGRRRVFLVDPADRMNREAANALLKTLEEPPPSACIVLLTANRDALPATIRSRCQAVRFAPLALEELTTLLQDEGHDAATAERLARLAGGSVGRALEVDLEDHDARLEAALGTLEAGDLLHALQLAGRAGADVEAFEECCRILTTVLRDLALLHEGAHPDQLVHAHIAGRLQALADRYGARAPREIDRLEEALRFTRGNVNARLAAEAVLIPLVTSP